MEDSKAQILKELRPDSALKKISAMTNKVSNFSMVGRAFL